MQDIPLGNTGLRVSRLAFGTAFMGPLSDRMPPPDGARLLLDALARGVSTWDTSDDYGTHPHVAHALRQVPRQAAIVASKTREPAGAVNRILAELGTDYLDILYAHEVPLSEVEAGHEALRLWQADVARGKVRALGIATHSARVAWLAAGWPETSVLLLPLNRTGACTSDTRIEDGGVGDMERAARRAYERGKGVIAMKVMGCGAFAAQAAEAIAFAARLPYVHSLCIGMRSLDEVEENLHALADGAAKPRLAIS